MRELFLGLYFFLLFYLAIYGANLYSLIYLYFSRKYQPLNRTTARGDEPTVTVQLPMYNERRVAQRLIDAACSFDWPADRLEVQVLDDSDDDTAHIIAETVAAWQARGINVRHIRRPDRSGYKAGALAYGLARARSDFVAVFDADNLPRSDFLRRMMPYFDDDNVGLVQARWSFFNRNESLLCRAQALQLDSHFFVEQAARSRGEIFLNFNGTGGIWRTQTITDAGGWSADTLTEDLDLSYRAQMAGWKFVMAEEIDVPTELPSTIRAYKSQQYRWARGAFETGLKILPTLLRRPLPLKVKAAAFFHLTQKSMSVALMLLAILIIPALYIRLEGGLWKLLAIDLPIFLAGTGSMSIFYSIAYKRQQEIRTWKNSVIMPMLTSIGIALAVNNTLAVLAALFAKPGAFIRTPKSGTMDNQPVALPSDYRVPFDHTAMIEFAMLLYTCCAFAVAISLNLWPTLPFLTTFVVGYAYFSLRSLKERYV